jgi:hypothetical protein
MSTAPCPSEAEILARYSTPELKRGMLSRYGKKWHLMDGYRMTMEEWEELLDELYGEQPMSTELDNLRAAVEALQNGPDSVFGFDLTGFKSIAADAYNLFSEIDQHIAALEAAVKGKPK